MKALQNREFCHFLKGTGGSFFFGGGLDPFNFSMKVLRESYPCFYWLPFCRGSIVMFFLGGIKYDNRSP